MRTLVGAMVLAGAGSAYAQVVADDPVGLDPVLEAVEHRVEFDPRLKGLWVAALGRPDGETRMRAAEAIGKAAGQGMTGLADTGPVLVGMLDQAGQPLEVKLAVLRAVIALKVPGAGATLLAHGKTDGLAALLLTDEALADWNDAGARAAWRARLKEAGAAEQAVASAVRCLGKVKDAEAGTTLLAMATDGQRDGALRVAAAEAAGAIGTAGLDTAAAELLTRPRNIDHVVAVTLLGRVHSELGRASLSQLAADDDAVVVSRAVEALVGMDPKSIQGIQGNLLKHADADVRRNTARGLAGQKSEEAVGLLGGLLGDASLKVREAAAEGLVALDKEAGLKAKVRATARGALRESNSHAVERGAEVLGAVGEKSAAEALVGLLESGHASVRVAALVALRRLAVPETCPAILAHGQKLADEWFRLGKEKPGNGGALADAKVVAQLVEVCEALGLMRYRAAEGMLMRFVPKEETGSGTEARIAAIWALGKIYADRDAATPAGLAGALTGRVGDADLQHPEIVGVRAAAAIALGRMKNPGSLGALRGAFNAPPPIEDLRRACRWGIGEITGKPGPEIEPVVNASPESFLEPTR